MAAAAAAAQHGEPASEPDKPIKELLTKVDILASEIKKNESILLLTGNIEVKAAMIQSLKETVTSKDNEIRDLKVCHLSPSPPHSPFTPS